MNTFQTEYVAKLRAETLRQHEEVTRANIPHVNPRIMEGWEELPIQIEKLMLSLPPVMRAGLFEDYSALKLFVKC